MINTEQTKKKKKGSENRISKASEGKCGKEEKKSDDQIRLTSSHDAGFGSPFFSSQAQQNFYLIGSGGRQPWPTSGLTLDTFAM